MQEQRDCRLFPEAEARREIEDIDPVERVVGPVPDEPLERGGRTCAHRLPQGPEQGFDVAQEGKLRQNGA